MLRSPLRQYKQSHLNSFDPSEQMWPDETIVLLPETPRVRLSPRRKMNPQTPGWPPAHIGTTIRMYHDDENQDETVNFTMNPEFIENMQSFIPPISPTKVQMLSPSRSIGTAAYEDGMIEIPDSAGLNDETRDAIYNVWANDDFEDSGFVDGMHCLKDCQASQYKQRNGKLNLTIRYLVKQLQAKEKENQKIPILEKKLINLQTQLKSLALVPMTPMRTSSLKHMSSQEGTRTPRSVHSKENLVPRSLSVSPRKPLQEVDVNNIQPSDLVHDNPGEFIEYSKRIIRNLQLENESLRNKMKHLGLTNVEQQSSKRERIDTLQAELERLVAKNHRLEIELQTVKSEASLSSVGAAEIARLSEELEWHAKLHLYAEKERKRLLDLLDFAGREGEFTVREAIGLREKLSKISLRSGVSTSEAGSSYKCLV